MRCRRAMNWTNRYSFTEVRYRNGAIALKNLIDAQKTTRDARLSLVQTKQSQYNAYVTLMQALGGSPIRQLP